MRIDWISFLGWPLVLGVAVALPLTTIRVPLASTEGIATILTIGALGCGKGSEGIGGALEL